MESKENSVSANDDLDTENNQSKEADDTKSEILRTVQREKGPPLSLVRPDSFLDGKFDQLTEEGVKRLDEGQSWLRKISKSRDSRWQDEADDDGDDQDSISNEPKISWVFACFLIIAGTVSLGALAMASNFAVLGFIPALVMVIILGILASYTGYLMWDFYMMNKEEEITNYGQAARLVLGHKFGTFVHVEQCVLLFWFISATIKSAGQAMYALSQNHFCLAIVTLVATGVGILVSFPIYLRGVSVLSAVSFASIVVSMMINVIGVAAQKSPDYSLPQGASPYFSLYPPATSTAKNILASTTTIIFAYAGHLVFFEFIHAMRRPREFFKALALAQTFAISSYGVVGSVIYHYTGVYSKSPALFNLAPYNMYAILGWVTVLPNLFIGGVIDSNILCHNIADAISSWINSPSARFPRIDSEPDTIYEAEPGSPGSPGSFQGRQKNGERQVLTAFEDELKSLVTTKAGTITWKIRLMWTAVTTLVWLISYLVAQVVPTFNGILGIASSVFSTQFTYGLPCVFWLISVHQKGLLRKRWALASLNVLIILASVVVLFMGTLVNIRSFYDGKIPPFSCSL